VRSEVLTVVIKKMAAFWVERGVIWYTFTDVSGVLAASIIRAIIARL
jgi:hypothetical protein